MMFCIKSHCLMLSLYVLLLMECSISLFLQIANFLPFASVLRNRTFQFIREKSTKNRIKRRHEIKKINQNALHTRQNTEDVPRIRCERGDGDLICLRNNTKQQAETLIWTDKKGVPFRN